MTLIDEDTGLDEISSYEVLTRLLKALTGRPEPVDDVEVADETDEVADDAPAPFLVTFERPGDEPLNVTLSDDLLDGLWDALMDRNERRLTQAANNVFEASKLVLDSQEIEETANERYEYELARAFPSANGFW